MDFKALDNIDYDAIEYSIREKLEDKNEMIKYQFLCNVRKLAMMVIDNCYELEGTQDFSTKMKLNDSIQLSYHFFNSISKDYGYRFLNILNNEYVKDDNGRNYSVYFAMMDEEACESDRCSLIEADGSLELSMNGTIGDVYTIVHEFTHKLIVPVFRDKNGELDDDTYILEDLFREVPTVLNEFLLDDYILDSYGNISDKSVNKINRLFYACDNAIILLFVSDLLNLYKVYGKIDKDILVSFFDNMDKDSIIYELYMECGVDILEQIPEIDLLGIQSYIIAVCVASFLHKQIKDNPSRINDVIQFNSILGNSSYELYRDVKTLSKMNIPIITKKGIVIDDDCVNIFENCLEEDVKDCIGNSFGKI